MDLLTISAASGLRSRIQSLDLLANNLANSATGGFKSDREYYGLYASDASLNAAGDGPSSTLPIIEKGWIDFSQGVLQATGNQLDVAISGKGFLSVKGPNGPLYTRNGNLKVMPTGVLATGEGYPVYGTNGKTIQLEPTKPIDISTDGVIHQEGQETGQIAVVNFKSTDSLMKMGNTNFQNSDPKNAPTAATGVEVLQGKIEGSNVPVAEAAMRLVGVMRQFEMLQKAVGISSDMDTKTIQEVARVGS